MELKNYKRVSTGSEFRDVVQTANDEPRFRANGHELVFESANSDNIILDNQLTGTTNLSDLAVEVTFESTGAAGNGEYLFRAGATNRDGVIIIRRAAGNYQVGTYANGSNNNLHVFSLPVGVNTIRIENLEVFVNNSLIHTLTEGSLSDLGFTNPEFFGTLGAYSDSIGYGFSLQGETFKPTDINDNAQIVGSSGTVATVNTSHASGNSYILGTVFQKSSFALVGNGTTQKIVGHLGTDLILTSTPLEGGFTLDGGVYNLTEGLGNEIKSTTGETATIQGYTGTSLNFGGWQKGNSIDGWAPYTIV